MAQRARDQLERDGRPDWVLPIVIVALGPGSTLSQLRCVSMHSLQ